MDATYTLKFPYATAEGKRIETLTLRQPTVADMRRAKRIAGDDFEERSTHMVAACCGLIVDDLDSMALEDYLALAGRFQVGSAGE